MHACAPDKAVGTTARKVEAPLRVEVETQLDMGRVAVGAMGGEVEVDPVSACAACAATSSTLAASH